MEDSRIVELLWQRDEAALAEAERKYGKYCFSIAKNILEDDEDAHECVNDAYLGLWNAVPPHRPAVLSTFLGKITRRLSLKKWRGRKAQKRGGGAVAQSLEELGDCVPAGEDPGDALEAAELVGLVNAFLEALPTDERRVFLRRYWYFDSTRAIAERYGFGESKVKMTLKRTRDKLRAKLEREGYSI